MMFRAFTLSTLVCLFTLSNAVQAEDWTSWRGPAGDGTVEKGDYAVEWSADKNLSWSIDLPSRAGSTPVVVGNKIVLTATIDTQNGILCYDQAGKELWRQTIGNVKAGKHKKASGSNPSPVTDGKHVFVYYKSGDFAALDLSGDIVWQNNLQQAYGEDTLWWDLGTSPVLTKEHVVVACMQSLPSPSYLAAFNKMTGEEVWRVERETGAPEEAAQSYSTPVVTEFEGEEQIVVLGADFVTCHSAKDGKELWKVGTLNPDQERYFRSIASPVIIDGIVIAPYARGNTLTAIKMGGKGDVTKSHVLWTKTGLSSDVPTPTAQDGKVYLCTDKGTVACLEAKTGNEVWQTETPKHRLKFSASPVLAGDLLYLLREDATCFVVNTKEQKIVATNKLGDDEFVVSTPVLTNGQILVRTFEHLYNIGGKSSKVSLR
ncbi:PQQ-binding-like beta-propeller repeat protein [Planctomicrobium sp.]|nr:PQQ-binding-like beta-propeller repeat protein [Planctomicrobium sp.]